MLLISVEVSVKVACRSTTATDCSTELLILVEVPVKVACRSTQLQTAATEPSPCYLVWLKYLCKWLVGPHSYRLQPQSYLHATFPDGSIRECD